MAHRPLDLDRLILPPMRTLVVALGLLALAAAWHFGALAPLTQALRSATSAPGDARPGAPTSPGGLRKCVAGERVLYTDTSCPPGYASAAVQGNVSVVPPVVPASVPAARPTRAPAAEGTLREQMIDRAVNH